MSGSSSTFTEIAFLPPLPLSVTSSTRATSQRRSFARCSSNKPTPVSAPSNPLAAQPTEVPTLFTRPEAVLGVILAAAALLADFARGLSEVISRAQLGRAKEVGKRLEEVDDNIEQLEKALDGSKSLLAEMEQRLDETLARATSAESALKGMGEERKRLTESLEKAVQAEREIVRLGELGEGRVERVEELGRMIREVGLKGEEVLERGRRKEIGKWEREVGMVKGEMEKVKRDMEREMGELRGELRERDRVVNMVERECDELKSMLAAKEVELKEINEKLKGAMTVEEEIVNAGESAERLKEVRGEMEAEKMMKIAEIKKAEIKEQELEGGGDELERVKKVVGLEKQVLKAGLKRARNRVRGAEHDLKRKDDAVEGILESIRGEEVEVRGEAMGDANIGVNEMHQGDGLKLEDIGLIANEVQRDSQLEDLTRSVDLDQGSLNEEQGQSEKVQKEAVNVAKQAQSSSADVDVKPKKRRGRPPKAKSSEDVTQQEEKPKRKRGRPRKNPPVEE